MSQEKLIEFTTESWHYKLFNFVYGKTFGTPEDFQNLCPYFWLIMSAILIVPFKTIIYSPLNYIFNLINKWIENKVNAWLAQQSFEEIANYQRIELYKRGSWESDQVKRLPLKVRWVLSSKSRALYTAWSEQTDSAKISYSTFVEIAENKVREKIEKETSQYKIKQSKFKKVKESIITFLGEIIDSFFTKIANTINNIIDYFSSLQGLINATKKIIGTIITVFLAFCYFYTVYGIIYLIDLVVVNWNVTLEYLIILGWLALLVGIGISILFLIVYWIDSIKADYYSTQQKWYNKWIISLYDSIFYPLFQYVIIKPILLIFYIFLYKIVLIGIIVGIAKGFWNGFLFTTGIFGEYFSASYGDYCPGINWSKNKK